MADIFHCFQINASPSKVFGAVSTAYGLNQWWSENATGTSRTDEVFLLSFGTQVQWMSIVSEYTLDRDFELTMQKASEDWVDTKVGFSLAPKGNLTYVRFYHKGWKASNEHYEVSCYCWAMYLRLLKRYLEFGEVVPYDDRLEA